MKKINEIPVWFTILAAILLCVVGAILYLSMRLITHLFSADYVIAMYFMWKSLNWIMEKLPNE